MQMSEVLKPNEPDKHTNFTRGLLEATDTTRNFLCTVCFTNEATYHVMCEMEGNSAKSNM